MVLHATKKVGNFEREMHTLGLLSTGLLLYELHAGLVAMALTLVQSTALFLRFKIGNLLTNDGHPDAFIRNNFQLIDIWVLASNYQPLPSIGLHVKLPEPAHQL